MSKIAKNITASILAFLASMWLVAYTVHLLPNSITTYWFGFPLVVTSVIFVIAAFIAGLTFPFKE